MNNVFLLGGLRSHIGLTGGMFKTIPAEDLAAAVLKKVIERYPCALQADGLICGNAVGTGGNITRLTALKAGLPAYVPALTVDMQCASAAALKKKTDAAGDAENNNSPARDSVEQPGQDG